MRLDGVTLEQRGVVARVLRVEAVRERASQRVRRSRGEALVVRPVEELRETVVVSVLAMKEEQRED